MKVPKFKYLFAVSIAISGTSVAQVPFLDGYNKQQQLNQLQELRQLQMLNEAARISRQQQEMETRRQETARQALEHQRSQEQQRQANYAELQEKARRYIADNAKGVCVSVFLKNTEASEEFSRRGTSLGEVCGCVEQEMYALLTLDLASSIFLASNESAGNSAQFLASPMGQEWLSRYSSASSSCVARIAKK